MFWYYYSSLLWPGAEVVEGGWRWRGPLLAAIQAAAAADPAAPNPNPPPPALIAPTVTAVTPLNKASGVGTATEVTAIFSKAMDAATITTTTFTLIGTIAGVSVPVVGGVAYYGQSAIFTPPGGGLTASTDYTATITTGTTDAAGTALAVDFVWTFKTGASPDTTRPTVTLTVPANLAINVEPNTKIFATFSEDIDPATITPLTFTVTGAGGSAVAGGVTYADGARTAIFAPAAPLTNIIIYTATITTGAKDLAGNALAANYVWTFTAGAVSDTTAPTVTLTSPANLDINVCINKTISATFSEDVDPLTIIKANFKVQASGPPLGPELVGTIAYDSKNKITTFSLFNNLAVSTQYTATLTTGVKDLAGNALAADYGWTFTTGTTTCPVPVALGAAAPFGGFGGNAGMTNQGLLSTITGDIGTTAASTLMTGFHDNTGDEYTETPLNIGPVTGRIYTAAPPPVIFVAGGPFGGTAATFAIATAGAADALIAYGKISPAQTPGGVDPSAGELGGLTLFPGVYKSAGATWKLTTGNLTLDAQGDPNAVWVFQCAGGLTIGAPGFPRSVLLQNGAKAKNVFWYVGTAARIEDGCSMVGTIIADAGVTISTAGSLVTTTLEGRALGLNASVTIVDTIINLPQ